MPILGNGTQGTRTVGAQEVDGASSQLALGRAALLLLFGVLFLFGTSWVGVAQSFAAPKALLGSCGNPNGELGGQISFGKGVAVNQTGNGAPKGSVYIAEGNPNHRISQFDRDCKFVRSWGYDVVRSGEHNSGANEQQTVTLPAAATSGTFTLRWPAAANTTGSIQFNATPGEVQAALEGISTIGAGNINVTSANPGGGASAGGPYTVTFQNALGGNDQAQMTATSAFTPVGSAAIATTVPGGGIEICESVSTPSDVCKTGVTGNTAGQLSTPTGIAIDQSNGYLYVTSIGNRRVDVFSGLGKFAGAFGWGVDTGAAAPEVCTTASACQASAAAGAQAGNFSNFNGAIPAIDPNSTGKVYVPDGGNLRVSVYGTTVSGGVLTAATFEKAFGWDVIPANGVTTLESCTTVTTCQAGTPGNGSGQFTASGSPVAAVDGSGHVYVTSGPLNNSTCSVVAPCRVQKFDPTASTAADFGPATGVGQLTFTSAPATEVAALNIAIDPTNQNVFVLRKESSTTYRVLEFTSSGAYVETHPSGAALESSGAATATISTGLGVAEDGRLYTNYGSTGAGEIRVLGAVPSAEAQMLPAKEVGTNSAHLLGTVTIPELPGGAGVETKYNFEYSSDGGQTWKAVPSSPVSAGSTPGEKSVDITVTKLLANRTYLARLIAVTGESTESNLIAFQTKAASPSFTGTFVEHVTQTSADLGAYIEPGGIDTTYWIEWGTAPGVYPNKAPAFERQLGGSSEAVIVRESVSGLQAGTEYHFRVVASNSVGKDVSSEDQAFETLNSCGLTDGRCYELVSPPDKGPIAAAGDWAVLGFALQFQAAPDTSRLAYVMAYGLPNATSGHESLYEAKRSATGWTSSQLNAPSLVTPDMPAGNAPAVPSFALGISDDLECGIYSSNQILAANAPQATLDKGAMILYRQNADGTYTTITDRPPKNFAGEEPVGQFQLVGMSEEAGKKCDTVVFSTPLKYSEGEGVGTRQLYEWNGDALRNVGVVPSPGGPTAVPATPGAANGPPGGVNSSVDYWNAVSDDGSRIFFTAVSKLGGDLNKQAVFVRDRANGQGDLASGSSEITNINMPSGRFAVGQIVSGEGLPENTTISSVVSDLGGNVEKLQLSQPATASGTDVELTAVRSVDVSQSQGVVANNGDSRYETASKDGDDVFFTARYELAGPEKGSKGLTSCALGSAGSANGAGCDLYRYAIDDGTLIALSGPDTKASSPKGAGVAGVLDSSEDGSRVYFAARGQLIANTGDTEDENLTNNTYSVYLWSADEEDSGDLSYVGRIAEGDASTALVAQSGTSTEGPWRARSTPDGSHLLFESTADVTGYDSGGAYEAYLYDAAENVTVCVSCRTDLQASVSPIGSKRLVSGGTGVAGSGSGAGGSANLLHPPLSITEDTDGSIRVFFNSHDDLATGATAGRPNLYQWEEGQISFLASSAPSVSRELRFAGASATGDDVYFTTVDKLTWEDIDVKLDVYDARVGGGFTQPPAPPVPCDPLLESSCQGAASPSESPSTAPGSSSLVGPRNESSPETKPKKPKKKKKRGHKKKGGKQSARGMKTNGGAGR